MFEPYILLSSKLGKKVVAVSDNDKALSETKEKSTRYKYLEQLCIEHRIRLIEVENTLESDLFINKYLDGFEELLKSHKKHKEFQIAKDKNKVDIAVKLIEADTDLSDWHVIKRIKDEFQSN